MCRDTDSSVAVMTERDHLVWKHRHVPVWAVGNNDRLFVTNFQICAFLWFTTEIPDLSTPARLSGETSALPTILSLSWFYFDLCCSGREFSLLFLRV